LFLHRLASSPTNFIFHRFLVSPPSQQTASVLSESKLQDKRG
jgi:hypothetical protein